MVDEISRKYFQRVSEIFQEILIGLPLDEFKSIKLEGLIQHADEGHPVLHIIDKNYLSALSLRLSGPEQDTGEPSAASW